MPLKDYLTPNPILRSVIASLPTRNLIFTNADIHHARKSVDCARTATTSSIRLWT
jgi:hypothetical protein